MQRTPSGGSPFTLATNIGYSGTGGTEAAGASMQPTSASIANGTYTYTASFDTDLRLVTDSLTDGSATEYSSTRGYDAVGNVISEDTQLGAASNTDNQLFCYNEQNQLTWAGATGTSPCNGAVSSGSLTSAQYSQAYAYDAQGRLTSGAIGSYTYGDAAHPHAVTSIGGGTYTARYDAAGDLTCRAPNSSVTCAGTPTGASLAYDAERRLAHWQNTPTTPTTQDDYLYDGEGQRVEQYVNTSGTYTSTAYLLGGVEEVSGGVITKYLGAKGVPTAVRVGTAGSLSYLATDGLGSVAVAVDGSGNVVASQLFGPYGASRYSSGTMPTSKGFTGQRADATTGLDYYGARYYDPAAGQFVSADSVVNGPSRYAYVGGNPETATDPSGHAVIDPGGNVGVGYLPWTGGGVQSSTSTSTQVLSTRGSDGTIVDTTVTTTTIVSRNGSVSQTTQTSQTTLCDNVCHQIQAAQKDEANLKNQAAWYLILSSVLTGAGLLLDLLLPEPVRMVKVLEAIADGAILVANAISALGGLEGNGGAFYKAAAAVADIAAMANSALALIRTWGSLAQDAVTGAFFLLKASAEGIPAILESLVGGVVSEGLAAAGAYMAGQYYAAEAQINQDQDLINSDMQQKYQGG